MFVIVYNNNVILGPMRWNKIRFENEIFEECDELTTVLESRNDDLLPVIVSNEVKILPVRGTQNPEFNPTIEFLNGPFWTFTDEYAEMSYRAEPMNIDAVKNQLKVAVADERWKKQSTQIEFNGNKFNTDKDTMATINHMLTSGLTEVNWKIDRDNWVTLTKSDLEYILSLILTHIQDSFAWEYSKIAEIDACTELTQLADIEIDGV